MTMFYVTFDLVEDLRIRFLSNYWRLCHTLTINLLFISISVSADLIGNFYNENRRLVLDAVNPIYVSSAAEYFAGMLNKVLSKVPAKEFVAE